MRTTSDWPIVVGIDGSPEASHALRYAVREAEREGCYLWLVNAIHEIVPLAPMWPLLTSDTLVDVGHELLAEAQTVVEELSGGRVSVRVQAALGPAVDVLAAAGEHARLVVLGHRSPALMERIFTGSTTFGVAARASCPVLSVPRDFDADREHGIVVAAVDGTEISPHVLDRAFTVAAERSARLEIVHCWRLDPFYSYLIDEWSVQDEWRGHTSEVIDRLVEEASSTHPSVSFETWLEYADVTDTLVRHSKDADVLILGRHGHGTRPSALVAAVLGSVTRAVLHHARCPVEVVPAPRPAGVHDEAPVPSPARVPEPADVIDT